MEFNLLFLVAGAAWLVTSVLSTRRQLQGWYKALSDHGLKIVDQSGPPWSTRLEARAEELTVGIERARGKGEQGTWVTVKVPGRAGIGGLRIRREPLWRFKAREIEIGDKAFDDKFYIEGPAPLVAALLDAELRSLLTRLDVGSLQFEIDGPEIKVRALNGDIPDILSLLLDVGRRFARLDDAARSLAGNALQDPEAEVRLLNLRLLMREFPGEELARGTARQACADPSLEVRLHAATSLGDEGRDVLLELAKGMVNDACSAQAVTNLGEALPFEPARGLLLAALDRRRTRTALACLESLGRSGEAAAVDVLAQALEREEGELAAAAAKALGETGRGEAEAPLVQALGREDADVRVAAVLALGRVGSATAVLPLREAEESSVLDRELRRAARQAVAEIQARLPGASPGQLSLAGADTGQLSLAEAEAGQLSLAVDAAGQLSLADPAEPRRSD